MLDQWANRHGVEMDVSRPGKPTDNAWIEALNARVVLTPKSGPADVRLLRNDPAQEQQGQRMQKTR